MKTLRTARLLTSSTSISPFLSTSLSRFNSTSPLSDSDEPSTSTSTSTSVSNDFDSRDFSLPISQSPSVPKQKPTWSQAYRDKADRLLFDRRNAQVKEEEEEEEEDEDEVERDRRLARTLLEAALLPSDDVEDDEDEDGSVVKEEDHRSLSVGIIGAPNAGKSSLTNFMVGTKVAAVSRKTNTTTHEVLGVMTKGNTQINILPHMVKVVIRDVVLHLMEENTTHRYIRESFFDTPGLMVGKSGLPFRPDVKFRVENAWSSIDLYDMLIVIFDVQRHLTKPDSRVIKLIKHLGGKVGPNQKRLLCMNKVDLVENKKDLLKVAEEFEDLPGFERYFMVSGLKGSGVKDLLQYLMDQAVKRPWDEDPTIMSEEIMKNIALEVVREKMLDHIHQEIPYVIDHRLMDWKELRDGSLRIEQHFIAPKQSQRQILVGKNGSKIGRIGIEANEELRSIFKREVHLILQVRVARKKNA